MLKGGNIQVSKELQRYSVYHQKSRLRQTFKIVAEIKQLVEQQMRIDDETMAYQSY